MPYSYGRVSRRQSVVRKRYSRMRRSWKGAVRKLLPADSGYAPRIDGFRGYRGAVVKCCRSTSSTLVINSGGQSGAAVTFSLAALGVGTELDVFDQYCITGVKAVIGARGLVGGATADPIRFPIIYMSYDADDATPPTTTAELLKRSNVMRINSFAMTEVFFKPVPQVQAYGANIGYMPQISRRDNWINVASKDVNHYGMKFGWQSGGAAGSTYYYDITWHYYLKLRRSQ